MGILRERATGAERGVREYREYSGQRRVFYKDGKVVRIEENSNGDGKPDTFSYFENGQLVRKEVDRKHTGKIDLWGYYQEGRLIKQEEDLQGDGKVSRVVYFHGDEVIRREEDTAHRGRMDMIEFFSVGRVTKRLRDTKGTGKWDTVYYFEDNQLVREERDTKSTGTLILEPFTIKDRLLRKRRIPTVIVAWMSGYFQNGERIEQLEDHNYQGKITARYIFKGGQIVGQETLEQNLDPPRVSKPFRTIEEEAQKRSRCHNRDTEPREQRRLRIGFGPANKVRSAFQGSIYESAIQCLAATAHCRALRLRSHGNAASAWVLRAKSCQSRQSR